MANINTTQWKLNVHTIPGRIDVAVTIWRKAGQNYSQIEVLHITETGDVLATTVPQDGTVSSPTLIIQAGEFDSLVSAFVAYAREKGFRDANETYNEGKLQATERHLEDMRTLLKLK